MPSIGVAVAVPEPWAAQLHRYRVAIGDPTADGVPTHITLVPPTEVSDVRLEAVEAHLAEAAASAPPFRVHLRGTGSFRPVSPVVFVNVVEGIWGCEHLADVVRRGPLAVDLEFPYHPHVTVAHHVSDDVLDGAFADLADFDAAFYVDDFVLYVHEGERGWVPRRRYSLGVG